MLLKEQTWGKLIKFYRVEQRLKQEDLAVGICTSSYLSRIENGIVIADEIIYEQLFKRLGLNIKEQQHKEQVQLELLERLYEKLLSNEEIEPEEIHELTSLQKIDFLHSEAIILAKLVYSRYLLSIKEDQKARGILNDIEPFISWKYDRITQMYVAITAYAYLSFLEFNKLVKRELKKHCAQYLTTASTFEQANYEYHLAFANHRTSNFMKVLHHIEKVSKLFKNNY